MICQHCHLARPTTTYRVRGISAVRTHQWCSDCAAMARGIGLDIDRRMLDRPEVTETRWEGIQRRWRAFAWTRRAVVIEAQNAVVRGTSW